MPEFVVFGEFAVPFLELVVVAVVAAAVGLEPLSVLHLKVVPMLSALVGPMVPIVAAVPVALPATAVVFAFSAAEPPVATALAEELGLAAGPASDLVVALVAALVVWAAFPSSAWAVVGPVLLPAS